MTGSLPLKRAVSTIAVAVAMLAGGASSAIAASPSFTAHGSAEQVYALGAPAHASMSLLNSSGKTVAAQPADGQGGVLFRNVTPGSGYQVRLDSTGEESGPVTVHTDQPAPWDPSIYNQSIPDNGYTYLTTRDGTQLAIDVHPPTSPAGEPGAPSGVAPPNGPDYAPPYPTLIEYSGYGYADPAGPVNGIAVLANLMGFAVVDVNMRGTGCSGGAYDFFEPLQNLDGYDVIETIAHQPWVLGHKVGMMGISYGAISQLFTAQLNPPDLEAISPLSTIDATATTLYPGGILNTGFAVAWAEQRQHEAEPAGPNSGQPWAYQQIQQGDQTCKANQALHGEAANLLAKIRANAHYVPAVADPLDPVTFVNKIKVPTFMACQWEDEQTGGHCPDLVQHFTGTKLQVVHVHQRRPHRLARSRTRSTAGTTSSSCSSPTRRRSSTRRRSAPRRRSSTSRRWGCRRATPITLPPDPIQEQPTYAGALAAFEALPEVRVLFDNGAGSLADRQLHAGRPVPGLRAVVLDASRSPARPRNRGTSARAARSAASRPRRQGIDSVHVEREGAAADRLQRQHRAAAACGATRRSGSGTGSRTRPGTAVSYVSRPAVARTQPSSVPGAVHLWVQLLDARRRPPGHGQRGAPRRQRDVRSERLDAGQRAQALDRDRQPVQAAEHAARTRSPASSPPTSSRCRSGTFVEVVIPLYYEGHAYRAGSRIRVTIAAPNGTQPIWSFGETQPPTGTSTVSIAFSKTMPSSLVLPVVPGVSVPTSLPPCPSLRNEPCRPYVPIVNRTG